MTPETNPDRPADEAVHAFDRWLETEAASAPTPSARGLEKTVAALGTQPSRRRLPRVAVPLAAAALVLLGLGLGLLIRGGDGGGDGDGEPPVPAGWAEHERRVFAEIRESFGDEVAWVASSGGEIKLGFAPGVGAVAHRVVFLELRDAEGRLVHSPRLVVPDGREVEVRLAALPRVKVRATELEPGRVHVDCSMTFADGATLSATTPDVASGERVFVGQVRTDGAPLALYAAAR